MCVYIYIYIHTYVYLRFGGSDILFAQRDSETLCRSEVLGLRILTVNVHTKNCHTKNI